jgi:hypothetical protein
VLPYGRQIYYNEEGNSGNHSGIYSGVLDMSGKGSESHGIVIDTSSPPWRSGKLHLEEGLPWGLVLNLEESAPEIRHRPNLQ